MHPYEDGSKADRKMFEDRAQKRRQTMTADQAVQKIILYLKGSLEVTEMDLKRLPESQALILKNKKLWAEAMIYYINHNV